MHDQADQLRRLVRETVLTERTLLPGVPLVVISGGNAGVGTTTLANRLAQELSLLGNRTVLVDANPARPGIAPHWNVQPHAALADVLGGNRTLVEVLQPVSNNVRLLPGRWDQDSPPDLSDQAIERLLAELRTLGDATDIVLADVGSGMSPWVHRFWQSAQQVLLVTSPEPTAVMDSYATIKMADSQDLGQKLRIVVNRCSDSQQARGVVARLDQTCQRFLGISLPHGLPIANRQESDQQGHGYVDDFQQSVRLLAAEVVGYSLAISQRHSGQPTPKSTQKSEPTVATIN